MSNVLPPGFDIEGLVSTYSTSAGAGLDSGLPNWLRFLSGIVKSLLTRRGLGLEDSARGPAIFFLSGPKDDYGPTTRNTTFIQGQVEVNGSIWFMNEEARRGNGVPHQKTAEELLDLARSDPDLAGCPTVLFIPTAPESPIVFFQRGLANEAEMSVDYELMEAVSAPRHRVNEAISKLHADVLESPNGIYGSFSIWADPARHKPIERAERELQAQVRATLVNAIPSIHASEEEMNSTGRFDIGLVQINGNTRTYHGLLELKVLRKGKNARTILEEGLQQAYSYGDDVGAMWTEVCAFDMRDVDPDSDPYRGLRSRASDLGVHLERWFLFPTAQHLRQYRVRSHLEITDSQN